MASGVSLPISNEQVREELDRVLGSHEFRASKRSQDFLRYVVEHALTGQGTSLKERTIGVDVFGRPASYDPSDDATVRVKAGEVRKRLGLYYSGDGAQNPIRIELPSGTYVPEFHSGALPLSAPAPSAAPPPTTVPAPVRSSPWRRAAMLAVVLIAAGMLWYLARPRPSALDQFWAPVLDGKSPVLVCASFVPVWNLDRVPGAAGAAKPEDYVQLTDQFVGGGDLVATSRLATMLTRTHHPFRVKVGNEVSFADLRSGPAVLVGYSYTSWREISKEMRYFIDANRRPVGITDNGKPTPWSLPDLPRDHRSAEDYAIISRVFNPDTHAMVVEIAGILQYGTDAAGDLVTSPELMAEALRGAPAGWQQKNLQMVVHVKVIDGCPAAPKVVQTYFW